MKKDIQIPKPNYILADPIDENFLIKYIQYLKSISSPGPDNMASKVYNETH